MLCSFINMDFSSICRTCLKTDNLNPIFSSVEAPERYSTAIYVGTGVQVKYNDSLPQNMCLSCITQLNSILQFRKQCQIVETHLLKVTENTNNYLNVKTITHRLHNKIGIKAELCDINEAKYFIYTEFSHKLLENNDLVTENDDPTDNDTTEISNNINDYYKEETFDNQEEYLTENFLANITEERIQNTNKKNNQKTLLKNNDNEENCSKLTEEINDVEMPYNVITDSDSKVPRVICKLCQKELSIRSIDAHMARRHPGADQRKVKCELCDRYVMRDKLNRHNSMMHGTVNFIKCGYCKKQFESKTLLVDHVDTCTAKKRQRKVNESGRKLAECDICQKVMQKASLKMHKAVKHAGLRPVCEHCGRSFGNKFRLKEHYRAKHGYEKFRCTYCEFTSASVLAMKNHERRHRGEKPFVCDTCGAKFHAAYLLTQHKHSHRTEKLVKCDLCPASFKANNSLHMHKLTCHSKSVYRCTVCSRSYKCRYYAVKHVRLAHSQLAGTPLAKIVVT